FRLRVDDADELRLGYEPGRTAEDVGELDPKLKRDIEAIGPQLIAILKPAPAPSAEASAPAESAPGASTIQPAAAPRRSARAVPMPVKRAGEGDLKRFEADRSEANRDRWAESMLAAVDERDNAKTRAALIDVGDRFISGSVSYDQLHNLSLYPIAGKR